ncbi:MAG: regulatory protein RecX [Betaproteobacteria bacterium]|nr:regulatory protein RecX [Betaproteobacteria bacterium]
MSQGGAAARAALRARALRLLAQREHSRAELLRKLGRSRAGQAEPDPELLAQVLDELQAQRLLDEQRFAQSLARRVARGHGSMRVLGELRQHRLDEQLVQQALRDAQQELEPESERALALLRRHHPQPGADHRQLARQMRFLQRRGFSADAIREALRAHGASAELPEPDTAGDA